MVQHISSDIAVIGAGVVGLAIAESLVAEGLEVLLIDPNPPGSGASYGNAGTIADYAVLPVGTPAVLRNLPALLFNRNSPLAIRPGAFLSLAPWLARFARQSLPGAAARNGQAITALLSDARDLWHELAARIGGLDLIEQQGCLYLYETEKALRGAEADMAHRRSLGVEVELISSRDLAHLEPGLPDLPGAAFFPGASFLSDPGAMLHRLAQSALQYAGLLTAEVQTLTRQFDGIILDGVSADETSFRVHAKRVIIAAGAHSRPFAKMAGDDVPLDTERGYHLEWDMDQPRLNRPACPTARGFYLCPMTGRLRAAGTVELGGLTAPPSQHRLDRLLQGARAIFPDLPEPSAAWMGFRPSMPDSLPVIGPSTQGPEVIHAFGHGHIGLTLAPITARIVTDLVQGRPPERDIAAFRPGRF
ncbi:FAD-dependent oxidoreductase [bacterium]|nr:FAD-dependent oxidoreductase [bacterium]